MTDLRELADRWATPTDYRSDPVRWCAEKGGEFMYSSQVEILESVRDVRYTAVHSAHDMGKSKTAANAITWWIDSHAPGEAFVVSTAPTAAQVSAILWREITRMASKTGAPGKINRAGYPQWVINENGVGLVGYGRKPADYEESAFQGIHELYVLIVIDEACGVAAHLFDAVDALATNEYARVLAIGNPDDPGSHFASICKPGSGWNVIHLDGLRSPNMTKRRVIGTKADGYGYANPKHPYLMALMEAEGIPYSTELVPDELRPLLLSELWVEERIKRWAGVPEASFLAYEAAEGERVSSQLKELVRRRCASSPIFQAKVRGIFPNAGTEGVIPLGWVQLAVNRWHDLMDTDDGRAPSERATQSGAKIIGVDVARGGEDETAIAVRYGSLITEIHRFRQADTMETADSAAAFLHEPGSVAVVDVIGIGAGVYDSLRRMRAKGLIVGRAVTFNASASTPGVDSIGEFRFRNDRSAAWWRMRELLDPSRGSQIALPDDERLIEELVAPKYKHHVGGIIVVETKEEIKKKLGRSTDTADAVIQAFWAQSSAEAPEVQEFVSGSHDVIRHHGYDPFTDQDLYVGPGILGGGWGNAPRKPEGWDL